MYIHTLKPHQHLLHGGTRVQVIVSDPEVQAQLEQQIGDFGAAVEKRPPNEMAQVS